VADLTTTYTLSTSGGTIVFNNGALKTTTDLYWIQTLQGLDGAPVRAPVDPVPFGDGGLVHRFWKGPRRIVFDGVILIQSVPLGGACQEQLNVMEEALRVALESTLDTPGSLSWVPLGQASRLLTVKCEVALDVQPIENYALRSFSFGLVSPSSDW
jgi:hypothetical protein